jgi:hypothetical protein
VEAIAFQYLAAAGDIGIYLLIFGFWRIDKRISWLEFHAEKI